MVSLTSLLGEIIVDVILVAPFLWLVGRAMVGKEKAKFRDALWIVVLGVIINAVLSMFVSGLLGLLVTLVVWVWLIKHFFATGWGKAALVGIIALVALAIVTVVLALLLGLAIVALL